ncbi:MAG: phosphoglycerate dehydrogenase [Ignavibacterium album]|uniref:phosphoglycerate dehydrogenase n=1 Tax=Ignavibacterium album TaxID=591197 RepID=UPI0026E9D380|nr:phosphoglycerate dehydrogenase [Ignavibacterium album]MBI5663426.1 phosphoglycerate dehydrogenase [Ignavibacterium album]
MKKILVSDSVNQKSIEIFKSAGYSVTYKTDYSRDELLNIISDYNALVVRSATKVDAELISRMKSMEIIGRAGAGVDNIDINTATQKGILVMNTPGGNTISTAEHTMAMMLALCRNIPQANKSVLDGKWDRKNYSGTELKGKTLAILGLGKIGKEVAKRSKAFGLNIIGFDPLLSEDIASELGVKLLKLDDIWKLADIITVHVPLNSETKNLINKEILNKCKDGVKIINCARGGIVNESELLEALNKGKVSGAALDVYETEPPDFGNPLLKHPKVICTPHLGASTEEAQELVAIQIAEQIVDYFSTGKISGAVNLSAFSEEPPEEIKMFFNLCEKLGIFSAQLLNERLKKITIELSGENLHKFSKELSLAFAKGFLSKKMAEAVNYVNTPIILRELKISIDEKLSSEDSTFRNLISVEMHTDKYNKKISGTVFGKNELRIIRIDEYLLEVKPEGNLLVYKNIDKPGMLASVGKILAEKNINIAGLSLGRITQGKDALTIISTDDAINAEELKRIKELGGIKEIAFVQI